MKINTQKALDLIKNGWVLKTGKNAFMGHIVWLKHPTSNGAGCAKYLTHGVYRNLLKAGVKPVKRNSYE